MSLLTPFVVNAEQPLLIPSTLETTLAQEALIVLTQVIGKEMSCNARVTGTLYGAYGSLESFAEDAFGDEWISSYLTGLGELEKHGLIQVHGSDIVLCDDFMPLCNMNPGWEDALQARIEQALKEVEEALTFLKTFGSKE
jgi:hypothetical protein